jgi:hypothetical protein
MAPDPFYEAIMDKWVFVGEDQRQSSHLPMNEQNRGAGPVESTSLTMPYKDRSTGLVVFGIFTILLGCLCGLFVPLMLLGQAMAPANAQTPFSAILPAIFMYGALAVALVWLGIGSIMARRWARALLLIFSWSWLATGLLVMAIMAVVMPKVLGNLPSTGTAGAPALPGAAVDAMLAVMFLVDGFLFIVLPAAWTFFYNSRHVKATCEARNPVACWTDGCPLPVLGLCAWLLFSVPTLLGMPLGGHAVMPLFGMFVTGLPAMAIYFLMAALWAYAAWLLYRLDPRGWWLILIAMIVFMVSGIVTYSHHDILEMYRLMGYPEAQIEQIQKSGLLVGNMMVWMMSIFMAPILGYLFFIKKYFRREL